MKNSLHFMLNMALLFYYSIINTYLAPTQTTLYYQAIQSIPRVGVISGKEFRVAKILGM